MMRRRAAHFFLLLSAMLAGVVLAGTSAAAQSLTQAADGLMAAFENRLPPEARQMVVRPFGPSGARLVENQGATLWRVSYGRALSSRILHDYFSAGVRVEFDARRYRTREAAVADCQRNPRWPTGSAEQALQVPARLARYECARAFAKHDVERQKLPHNMRPYEWRTRVHVFSRGPYVVEVSEHAISDDVDHTPAPQFPAQPLIDEIADRLDRLTDAGSAQKPATGSGQSARPPDPAQPGSKLTKQSRDLVSLLKTPEGGLLLSALGASALSALGALLAMTQSGVPATQALNDLGNLLRGRLPPDAYADWRARQQALGNRIVRSGRVEYVQPMSQMVEDLDPGGLSPFRSGQISAAPPTPPLQPRDGETNPATGEVWSDEDRGWVSRSMYDWEQKNRAEIKRIAEYNRTAVMSWQREAQELSQKIAEAKASQQAAAEAEAQRRALLASKLSKAYAAEGKDPLEIAGLLASGNSAELQDRYASHLRSVMNRSSAEAAAEARWATAMDVGYYTSKIVLAGAKTGLMAVGGPMSAAVSIGANAVISGVEEGTTAYLDPSGKKSVAGSFAAGFVSGVKDGAIGRYTNLPGTSTIKRVLLPAAGDAGEMYLRTGDVEKSLTTGLLSASGGVISHGMSDIGHAGLRGGTEVLAGGIIGGAQSQIAGGSFAEGFADGLASSIGSKAGGAIATAGAPMTAQDLAMDAGYRANRARAEDLAGELDHALRSGSDADKAKAVNAVLSHREARQFLKTIPDETLKKGYADLADAHRTKPLIDDTVNRLNKVTMTAPDGTTVQRYGVMTDSGKGHVLVPIDPAHFRSGSGTQGGAPGMDLDLYVKAKIIDKATGRPLKPDIVDDALGEACASLGISRKLQEINYVHPKHAEAFALQPGEDPQAFIARGGTLTGREAQSVTEVAGYKLNEAKLLYQPGQAHTADGGASSLSELSRIAIKDHDRLTTKLLETHPDAQVPAVFSQIDGTTGRTPLDIMREVGNGTLSPGIGNAQFRALTGMSLESGATKLVSLPEFIGKGMGGGGQANTVYVPGTASTDITGAALREAMRSTLNRSGR
ncbi:MAG TPA: hypothetical protein PLQ11_01575 [Beijerinckiaceae bacterium]|nr:hypothetical protein [Beijerinckiaceae bacterium]